MKERLKSLEYLETFVVVGQEANFTRAAKKLGLTQSAVSKKITALEKALAVTLFERSTREVLLTEAGKQFLLSSIKITAQLKETESELISGIYEIGGNVNISCPSILANAVSKIITEVKNKHPDLSVKIEANDKVQNIFREEIDISFRISENISSGDYIAKKISNFNKVVCASPHYINKYGEPKQIHDLEKHKCILFFGNNMQNKWTFQSNGVKQSIILNSDFITNDNNALLNATLSGLGVACIPSIIADKYLQQKELVELLKREQLVSSSVFLLYKKNKNKMRTIKKIIEYFELFWK